MVMDGHTGSDERSPRFRSWWKERELQTESRLELGREKGDRHVAVTLMVMDGNTHADEPVPVFAPGRR